VPPGPEGEPRDWAVAPRLAEADYSVTDAVIVGTLLSSLLRHCDRVAVACQAQLVNVLGLIRTEPRGPAWKQATALPFEHVRRSAVGESLHVRARVDRHATVRYGDVDTVDAAATWDDDTATLALFLVNRDPAAPAAVDVALAGFGDLRPRAAHTLAPGHGLAPGAANTRRAPDHVRLRPLPDVVVDSGSAGLRLPPLSWSVVRLERSGGSPDARRRRGARSLPWSARGRRAVPARVLADPGTGAL
jgi:alpha-L-arabinofuranosidase